MLGTEFGPQRLIGGAGSLGSAGLMLYRSGMGFTPLGLAATGMMAINGVGLQSLGLTALGSTAYGTYWLYNGGIGDSIGSIIGNTITAAVEGMNFEEIAKTITRTISQAFSGGVDEGIKKFDFKKIAETLYDEIGEVSVELWEKVANRAGEAATNVMKNMSKDVVIRVAPWLALGTAITVGTPLAIYYGYKRLVHNIGKPRLAQEVKNNNLFDRAYEVALGTLSLACSNTSTYLKWSYGTGVAGYALSFMTGMSYQLKGLYTGIAPYTDGNFDGLWALGILEDGMCGWINYIESMTDNPMEFSCEQSKDLVLSYERFYWTTIGIGVAAVAYNNLKGVYKYVKSNWGVTKSKPIFNDSIKEAVDDVIESTKNLQRNGGYFQNMILYGPGGTGKTMISKYIARNSGMNYIMMSGGDLAQYIKRGEHVTELIKIFDTANNSAGPSILFIDEAESLCRDRSKMNRDELFELLNSFLNQTGEPSEKIMLILATNRLEDIDEAVLSRMDSKVFVGPPEFEQRKRILAMYASHFFSKLERRAFFNEEALNELSRKTDGLTGRALFKLLNALSTKQKCSATNRLTPELVNLVVDRFVKQELDVKEAREAAKVVAA